MKIAVRTLSGIVSHAEKNGVVRRTELKLGDCVVVATANSVYAIAVEEGSTYQVRGGWFDRQGTTPVRTSINGCTWGGRVIQTGVVAFVGLHLEFSNQVVTSPFASSGHPRRGGRTQRRRPRAGRSRSSLGLRHPLAGRGDPPARRIPTTDVSPAGERGAPFTTARAIDSARRSASAVAASMLSLIRRSADSFVSCARRKGSP